MSADISVYIERSLQENPLAKLKLNLGCGFFPLEGWMNTDIDLSLIEKDDSIMYLDATKPFPIPDSSISFIYTEHLIEHLSYRDLNNLLDECFRVLKADGILRISTPNIQFLVDLYLNPSSEKNKAYIEYDSMRSRLPSSSPIYAINRFHSLWGHKFIYDPKSLTDLLNKHHYRNVVRCNIGESLHEDLKNVESHSRHFKKNLSNVDFNELQSMVFEAQK